MTIAMKSRIRVTALMRDWLQKISSLSEPNALEASSIRCLTSETYVKNQDIRDPRWRISSVNAMHPPS